MLRVNKLAVNFARAMTTLPSIQKVVLIRETGGPEVIRYEEDFPLPKLSSNDLLIKNKYAGVNFIESYFREGLYPCEKPYVLGREAVGTVIAKGVDVSNYEVGEKVAYLSPATFAQYTKISSTGRIVKLPNEISDEKLRIVAGSMLSGLTCLTFINEAYNVQKGDFILLYAAAGGAGLIFNQLLRSRGARTIAVASSEEKLELAKEYGAEFLINSSTDDILAKVMEITNGEGVAAAFDSVGKDTFETTFQAVKRKGTIVSFGNASGPVPPLSLNRLSAKNLKVMRPQLFGYLATEEEWNYYSTELIGMIDADQLKIKISKIYPLKDYRLATVAMESRKTVGKLLLQIPE